MQVNPPGSPKSCAEDAHCSYSLSVEEGLQLVLEFTGDFDVEAKPNVECADAVRIVTRSNTHEPFCGTVAPGLIDTGSSKVQIQFDSESAGTNKGFTIVYKTKRMTCPIDVTPHSTVQPLHQQYVTGATLTVTCDKGSAMELVRSY
ncbi:hypothetical protein ACEWY4_020437 [Coilia grayii]|uniref:CUB domain-containing protein n=1 Tax=Coilia grayii TaxID=363190 RepID=A0ABD1JCN3_9TELE